MVLLAPRTYNWIKNKGRAEGREEGKKDHQKRVEEACKRFGVEMDGKLVLPITPEVQAFLRGEAPEDSDGE